MNEMRPMPEDDLADAEFSQASEELDEIVRNRRKEFSGRHLADARVGEPGRDQAPGREGGK